MSSKRLVRKQSLISKVQSFPIDTFLYFNEIRLSIDWDEHAPTLALPLGVISCILSIVIQSILSYYSSINSRSRNILFDSNYYQYENIKSSLRSGKRFVDVDVEASRTNTIIWILNLVQTAITVLSIINLLRIFLAKKNYQLLYSKTKPKYKSAVHPASQDSYFVMILYFLFKYLSKDSEEESEESENQENGTTTEIADEEFWVLRVWHPSKFGLYLYVGMNPINNYIIYNFTPKCSSLSIIILVTLISALNFKLISNFLNLVQDKQIIYQEMFAEFNNKYVKPKTTTLKKDAMVDATMGPYKSSVLVNNAPYSFIKSKVFTTHDARGKPVTEYVKPFSDEIPNNNNNNNNNNNHNNNVPMFSRSGSRFASRAPSVVSSSRRPSVVYERQGHHHPSPYAFQRENQYYSSTPFQGPNLHSYDEHMANSGFPKFSRSPEVSNPFIYNRSPSPSHRSHYDPRQKSPQRLSTVPPPNLDYVRRGSIDQFDQNSYHNSPLLYRSPSPRGGAGGGGTPVYYPSPSPKRYPDLNQQNQEWQ
ncbi:NUR1 [Candida oxycetoniae]|uniref:Nuclear rim protein 1 n=1 Tax=Candida oxycetoniae TaxID=497107 RepID=A0AAI9WYR1_9ASCO|nr:NUR1 [Candida oxycetoniae]KAI3405572.2 NUR1 [Candida oxycetoniae]